MIRSSSCSIAFVFWSLVGHFLLKNGIRYIDVLEYVNDSFGRFAISIGVHSLLRRRPPLRARGFANRCQDFMSAVLHVNDVGGLWPSILPAPDVDTRCAKAWRLHNAAAGITHHHVRHLHESKVVGPRQIPEKTDV